MISSGFRRLCSVLTGAINAAVSNLGGGFAAGAALLLLAGCANQSVHRDAQNLVASGQVESGLALYQEALLRDPNNSQLRLGYAQTREKVLTSILERAERHLEASRPVEAEAQFRQALSIDPRNERARNAMSVIDRARRHPPLLAEASAELEKGNLDAARTKLSAVIGEDPRNVRARALLRDLDAKENALTPDSLLAAIYKKPISIEFRDAQIKQVFEVIALSSGLNILFDKDVKLDQKTSIFLKNSTIEAAIYYMLLTNQLDQQVMDANTLLIYPNNAGKQKEYQQLIVKKFLLLNANAKAISETLKSLMKLRDVVVDEKLNMLIVRDSPEAIRMAEKLIAMQDIAQPEVMLEVEVLEVSRGRLQELGISYPGSATFTPLASAAGTPLTVSDLRNLNGNRIGVAIDPLRINARGTDSDADLLANPRIRVLNHEKARIMIGNRVPSITTAVTATGIISESVNYLDVGLKLEVEPTIYLENDVAIRVGLEVSTVVDTQRTLNGTVTYTIGSRTANTILRLKDGENQVLAGLINDEDRRTANKIPGFGDIPMLGRLFGSTLSNGTKTEIVLSITPRLIRNNQRPDAFASEFMSGTESSLRRRPDLSPRSPVPGATPSAGAKPAAATSAAETVPGAPAPLLPAKPPAGAEAGKQP